MLEQRTTPGPDRHAVSPRVEAQDLGVAGGRVNEPEQHAVATCGKKRCEAAQRFGDARACVPADHRDGWKRLDRGVHGRD